jgi:hypothetical protein
MLTVPIITALILHHHDINLTQISLAGYCNPFLRMGPFAEYLYLNLGLSQHLQLQGLQLLLSCYLVIRTQESTFGPETIFISPPPPSKNYTFPPSRDTSFFDSYCALFAIIILYIVFI